MHHLIPQALLALLLAANLFATNLYFTPSGAGDKSGGSWENAAPPDSFQTMYNSLENGSTLYFGSGEYDDASFAIEGGDGLKIIAGKDTGGGLPIFRSHLDPRTKKGGKTLFSLARGAGQSAHQGFDTRRVSDRGALRGKPRCHRRERRPHPHNGCVLG